MSVGSSVAPSRGRGRILLLVAAVVVALVAVLLIGTSGDERPLDPESHAPLGASALVTLLDELGADVTVTDGLPDLSGDGEGEGEDEDERFDVILVLRDHMDDADRRNLSAWVRSGGVLVVADPESELAPLTTDRDEEPDELRELEEMQYTDISGPTERIPKGECSIDILDHPDISALEIAGQPTFYDVRERQSCFGDETTAFVLAAPRDDGMEVVIGGAGVWTNRALEHEDNAVLAAFLLAPQQGTQVNVLDPTARVAPEGSEDLWDVMPVGSKRALVQLALAFVVYVLWRSRRLGKPVVEAQPVKVASSELVAAVGGLLKRTGSPQHAAEMLRSDLHRDLVRGLGLPAGLPPDTFFKIVESRCRGLSPSQLGLALGPGPVTSDADLVAVVQSIDIVRKEVLESVGT